jgi:hypothetical protein
MTSPVAPSIISLSTFSDNRGKLTVVETNEIPFLPLRYFFSTVKNNLIERGGHSHKECSQILFCLAGAIKVICLWEEEKLEVELHPGIEALLVPPGVWCKEVFITSDSILGVLASHPYDPGDYIYESP